MAPKPRKNREAITHDGMFKGMVVFLVERGVQPRRIQIWKQKLVQMGATVEDRLSRRITHILAMNLNALLQQIDCGYMIRFKGNTLSYQWLEDSLKQGERVSEDSYRLERELDRMNELGQSIDVMSSEPVKRNHSDDDTASDLKRTRPAANNKDTDAKNGENEEKESGETLNTKKDSPGPFHAQPSSGAIDLRTNNHQEDDHKESLLYSAPDLNKNITEIFGKLINIYRALGDDRRSFSYYKAIPVIEKLPFKIDSADQVKNLPAIGKSMQDHIHEIITTGKLSKLEHFEKDEKVRTVTLFGEVWGIGPTTALKLYEKGYRTLTDLEKEESLTSSQRLGLNYFDDIKKRIPRNEVNDMEALLRKAGEELLPGVIVVCGGSYRRGKATCGDMDIVITHPDGESHKGFLSRYVQHLKDMNFLREDLVFSIHSTEGFDSGVDTYFGLCTYPGREQRHRIDLKVYPRDIYAFGLIAWTGNDVLNRRLRLIAESKGYRLDDTGLFLATQSSGGKKGAKSSTSVRCKTEKEVLDFLGYPWLEPHERNL